MSGGGSVPTAPNLSQNINQANQTFGTATSDASQTMNTAQAYNSNAQSNLQNVLGTTGASTNSIANEANQNMSTYGSSFVPLQQSEAAQAQAYGSDANVSRLQGQAVAGQNSANQAALANSQHALAAEGVDPASIQGGALQTQAAVQGAASAAQAGTNASVNAQTTAFNMANQANQLGTQVGSMGTSGSATAANTAQAGQSTENSTNSSGVNNLTAANSYLNTGVSANNSALTANQDQFSDNMQTYQAQQAASSGMLSSIGSIAGAAAMFMEKGGVVPQAIPTTSDFSAGGNVTSRGAYRYSPIPGSTDTKPAMLTPGEFVVPKDVVQHLGAEHFHRLVDKTREKSNERRAIPVPFTPHMSMH
jgi:trimeric autotransporter adhesin